MTRSAATPVLPTSAHAGALQPLSVTDSVITGGFWAGVQQVNREAILPHCDESLERVGWLENFRAAARGTLATERVGRLFTDSEMYKTAEAMLWENARAASPQLAARVEEYTDLLAGAQAPDGYLNTFFGYAGGPARYSDMEWGHELYCAGHLIQAAVAAVRTGGPRRLVDAAVRLADHICDEFGEGGRRAVCGHPEIETALVELYRATGERRYLDQAKRFVDRRGHRSLGDTMYQGRDYYQDNVPVRDAEVLVGHAVRALYLAAGAIDAAVETGDAELLDAVRRQYDRTLQRRTYLTGGMGSNHHGESFGEDFELPSDRAYAETCAAVASVHVAWRLLLATGDERYADVIERTLYNGVMSCPSVDGRSFFYVNTLHRRTPGIDPEPGGPSLRRTDGTRASWFTTSCCPTNLARLVSSLAAYVATTDDDGVQIHQYATGSLSARVGDRTVRLSVQTGYPYDGTVALRVEETDGGEWSLGLRVPEWARGARVEVAGQPAEPVRPGRVTVRRGWAQGDEVRLLLDVRPRWVAPDPRVDAVRGCLAVERGPLVYAAESVDQPDTDLDLVAVDPDREPADVGQVEGLPGVPAVAVHASPTQLRLLPYFRWANRGHSTMRVWLPRTDLPTA